MWQQGKANGLPLDPVEAFREGGHADRLARNAPENADVDIDRDAGGSVLSDSEVERILVANGRATGVRLAGGEVVTATRAVVANVTPTQLYGSLLAEHEVPQQVAAAAERFRYGRAEMQIHLALGELPRWKGRTRSVSGAARSCTSHPVWTGSPAQSTRPSADCSRPRRRSSAVSRSRSTRRGRRQASRSSDPAAGASRRSDQGGCGGRDRRRRRRAGQTTCARRTPTGSLPGSATSIENLDKATLERVVLSPTEIEAHNVNLVGGDIYGGSCSLDQNLLWRPLAEAPGHATAVDGLWHIGASTHPGPGLGAGSGYLVAKALTKPGLPQRLLAKLPGRS